MIPGSHARIRCLGARFCARSDRRGAFFSFLSVNGGLSVNARPSPTSLGGGFGFLFVVGFIASLRRVTCRTITYFSKVFVSIFI